LFADATLVLQNPHEQYNPGDSGLKKEIPDESDRSQAIHEF
jgi:hypothetical protein